MAHRKIIIWTCDRCGRQEEFSGEHYHVRTIQFVNPAHQSDYTKEVCQSCYHSFLKWFGHAHINPLEVR